MSDAFRKYGIFLFIPGFVLGYSILLKIAAGPYWLASNFDPSYEYLVNGLYMLKGIAPQDVAHPGTPLQILCCVVCWVLNIGRSASDVVGHALIAPEFYLHMVFVVLALFFFSTSFGLAVYVFRKTGDKLAAVLTQLPALSFLVLKSWETSDPILPIVANVSPEPLLMSVVNLFNICLLMNFFSKTSKDEYAATLFWGFVSGLGAAVKVTFIPLLVIPLIILSWKNKIVFFGLFSASFFVWTSPILPHYHHFFKWLIKIFTHTGAYGEGGRGVVEISSYLLNWKNIITVEWGFAGFVFVSWMMVFGRFVSKRWDKNSFFLLVTTFGVLFQFAVVAKHPGMHYLLPGLGLFSSLLVLFYLSGPGCSVLGRRIVVVLILVAAFVGVFQATEYRSNLASFTKEIRSFHEYVYKKYKDCIFLSFYRSSGQYWALSFGDATGNKPRLGDELNQLYPNSYFFNVWGDSIGSFKEKISSNDLFAKYHCVLFDGSGDFDFSTTPYDVHLLEKGRIESVFLLIETKLKALK